ncbi:MULTISPECIES: TetR/AcrR family transcriptional regulator [Paenibacillus]|uniref:TetR/AcrR family transcriptional regulator n=1 Tax=Paenibacillus TaxID=44249 RepID=UPI0022B8B971|nr:TetR/AcrR family transcriptional regulator [Paenibacillus caseinilyticus]MCZ8518262.1 TetR/AcrR family transcriptional regulator [Paenibacillus caseinilyticus]
MPKVIATEAQWIQAGVERFAQGGEGALVIEKMAGALGCSKSSFYWYFKDRTTLLKRVVEEWKERATNQVIDSTSPDSLPDERIVSLLKHMFSSTGHGDFLFYLRQLSLTDEACRRFLDEVETLRLDHMSGLLRQKGLPAEKAARRSRLLYHYYLGWYERHKNETISEEDLLYHVKMIWEEFVVS